ncbi:MAG: DoxX family protein [Chthoniobacterales bacterium]
MKALNRYADTIFCIMRLVVGLLLACHGAQKLLGMFGGEGMAHGKMLVAGIIELAGGFMIAFGLGTRIAAFLASGLMAWAYFSAHASGMIIKHVPPSGAERFFPLLNRGELAVVYCFVFLFIFFYGAGWLSLDALICRRKSAVTTTTA